MIENTWLVYSLSIGISYADFWHMNPHIIGIFKKAHEDRIREQNVMLHIQGLYVRDAIASTIGNAFRGNHKAYEYPKEPYELFCEKRKADMTFYDDRISYSKEEEQANAEKVFAWLSDMQSAFERTHARNPLKK